jgi:hypothetical protein
MPNPANSLGFWSLGSHPVTACDSELGVSRVYRRGQHADNGRVFPWGSWDDVQVAPVELETHISVSGDARHIAAWAAEVGASVLCLDLGDEPTHTNVSWSAELSPGAAVDKAEERSSMLRQLGVDVLRVKIEASAERKDLRPLYFEVHARVDLEPSSVDRLDVIARAHGARLSRRAVSTDGSREQRYVNLRVAPDGDLGRIDRLLVVVRAEGFEVTKTHREAVLVDSNLALDGDWLPVLDEHDVDAG